MSEISNCTQEVSKDFQRRFEDVSIVDQHLPAAVMGVAVEV